MRFFSTAALAAILSLGLLGPSALVAGIDNQRTELNVRQTIEVPGATLEPGDYIIELLGTDVVVIRDADSHESKAITITIPAKPDAIPSNSKLTFYESAAGQPPALRTWFYPGASRGHEFVYPEGRGKEIAKMSRRHVPTTSDSDYEKLKSTSTSDDPEPALVVVKQITIYSISPEAEKGDVEEGQKFNQEADAKTWTPDEYVRAHEMEESRIERRISKEIVTLPYYSVWDNIKYRLEGNKVTLMGSVYRPSMKKSVERVVQNVEGVSSVDNQIETQPTSPNDDRIRRAAYRAIYGHTALQDYQLRAVPPIHIIVENGKLTLEGVVQNSMDKNIAGVQANSVNGVFEVTNNLRTES